MNEKQSSSGLKVRDMVRRYDTAVKSESGKSLFSSSFGASKSTYSGLNESNPLPVDDDDDFEDLYADETGNASVVQRSSGSSSGSQKTVRQSRYEAFNNIPAISPLNTQKSFMNLSRSKEPPRAAPREKKQRHSSSFELESAEHNRDENLNISDASYQSKTTISKTPNGVRIIVDIFFDQNKSLAIEDVIGSRIETDIPPSKILKEFQKRVAEASQY